MTQASPTRAPTEDHLLIRSLTSEGGFEQEVGTITVLIGPNNVGKSAALADLMRLIANVEPGSDQAAGGEELTTRVIRDLAFAPKLTLDRLTRGLTKLADDAEGGTVVQGIGPDLKTPCRRALASEIKNILYRPVMTARSVRTTVLGQLMPLRVARLTPERCREAISPTLACSPLRAPEHPLQALHLADATVHKELDAAFSAAFPGLHVRLDATERVNLCLRVASEFPAAEGDPIATAQQYAHLPPAAEEGVGQQHYLGVVLTMLVCQGRVVLLDQPEAGLHPTQARQLGSWLAQNAARLGCQVFLATHSEALLGGLFEQNADVTILRLTRSGDSTALAPISPEIGNALVRSPVLAAQQAVDCLFSDGVVVVPQAEDCVVYETVARRFSGARGLRFLNGFGNRNLAALAKIFRRAGIPACVVADLESLQTEAGFSELVKAVTGDPPPAPWLATRERLAKHVEGLFDVRELSAARQEVESFLDQMRKGGPAESAPSSPQPRAATRDKWQRLQREQFGSIPQDLRVWVEELLDDLKHKGIFLSPKGGFQAWLPTDAPPGDREVGFAKAVQALHRGECPADLRAFVTEFVTFLRLLTQPRRPGRLRPSSDAGPM